MKNMTGHDSRCDVLHLLYLDKSMFAMFKQKNSHWLSSEGSLQWLSNKHDVVICDDTQHRERIKKILLELNQQPKQIKIRAKIMRVDRNDLHDLGASLQSSFKAGSKGQLTDNASSDLNKNGLKIVLGGLYAQQLLSVQLHALVENGHAQMVSNPSVLTSNGQAANIESGEEVPYQQGALSGGTSVAFKKAVMQLSVTPELTNNGAVNLKIQVHQDKVTPATVNGVPIISTEQLTTSAIVKKGNTLLLGGIIEKQFSEQKQGVPFLRHVPLLGFAFQRHRKEEKDKELLIMIQPSW
jgi:type IV pilus assembly protein PilQ